VISRTVYSWMESGVFIFDSCIISSDQQNDGELITAGEVNEK